MVRSTSITRARPGDENAPDRVSDVGPADIDRLVQNRAEMTTLRESLIPDLNLDATGPAAIGVGIVVAIAVLMR